MSMSSSPTLFSRYNNFWPAKKNIPLSSLFLDRLFSPNVFYNLTKNRFANGKEGLR
ncbi:hypothetical protein BH10PAT3_BH10PAT3_0990 [soil metagenome]